MGDCYQDNYDALPRRRLSWWRALVGLALAIGMLKAQQDEAQRLLVMLEGEL